MFKASIAQFLVKNRSEVFGNIVQAFHGIDQTTTNDAWIGEIDIMQQVLQPWRNEDAYIFFEYDIPRLGKRIDGVLLIKGVVFCLEFKVGKRESLQRDMEQVLDYALDLKNFHLYSNDRPIAPILVPTEYERTTLDIQPSVYDDEIFNPLISGQKHLQNTIMRVLEVGAKEYDRTKWGDNWLISPYSPTPTIIEASRTLYENHSVEDITRHEADKVSTDNTINYILHVIEHSKQNREKILSNFRAGRIKFLFATDLAARGLDLPDVSYVINFEIPSEVNTYLHRSGRTGRMNKSGTVVTLGDDHDFRDLKKLLADTYQVQRAYFAGYSLTTEKPKRKKEEPETQEKKVKKIKPKHKKKRWRNKKNKGYHPRKDRREK